MNKIHDERCIRDRERYEDAFEEFEGRWPDYCRECCGFGFHSFQENFAPHGSGYYWPNTVYDPCFCIEEGICPRCGREWPEELFPNIIEEELLCPHCDWLWGEGDNDTAPLEPECLCWMRERYE